MSHEVGLAAVSLTWREAPTALRERASVPVTPEFWASLRGNGARGLIALHTCARSMWLFDTESPTWVAALWQAHVAGQAGVSATTRTGVDALRFALRVAVGLDSYQQGEADIGRQFARAVVEARAEGRLSGALATVGREAATLVSAGLAAHWVRPNRGVGALAADDLSRRGVPKDIPVGVIGAGAIGLRVVASLKRAGFVEPVLYNRTPRPGTRPLSELGSHPALVVCTAGPPRWLKVDAPLVLDVGVPPQVDGPSIGLDALLAGDGLRLGPEQLAMAEEAVEAAVMRHVADQAARHWRQRLGGVRAVRDQFLDSELERLLDGAITSLEPRARRRVLTAARGALRRYDHAIVTLLRDEGDRS